MILNGILPAEFFLFSQHCEPCGGKRLCVGGDGEQSIAIHLIGFAEFANTVAFGQDNFTVLNDCHCEPRDLPRLAHGSNPGIDFLNGDLFVRCKDLRRRRSCEEQTGRQQTGDKNSKNPITHDPSASNELVTICNPESRKIRLGFSGLGEVSLLSPQTSQQVSSKSY